MYAMLTLDLDNNVTSRQRTKFYEYLENEQWKKIKNVTTTWYAGFDGKATEAGIIAIAKKDVSNAAKHSGVSSYDAVVHAGPSKPTLF